MEHPGDHHHEYSVVRQGLTSWQMTKLIALLQGSERYRVDDLSHISAKGNGTYLCVGYLGDDTAELVDPQRRDIRPLHRQMRRIFRSV